ncbi:MAG: DNA integrity scanning protein DisA nucleotide-binding domain protein [Desulfosarcinaceae bacterium]|jgi:hypothetical protein
MADPNANSFVHQVVSDTLEGLREGLSHFSGISRAAVIYAIDPDDALLVCDPQKLLHGHEPKFRRLFLEDTTWREKAPPENDRLKYDRILTEPDLGLAGLISCGGRSSSVFYQMWFTEHHPDMCAVGPTERWLEHACWRFSHDIANGRDLYTGISGSFLREYATHAVRDHIVDDINLKLGWDSPMRVYPILDAVLGISKAREEGAWPRGMLLFSEPRFQHAISFVARLRPSERPQLGNHKHVCKLLQAVAGSTRKLVSDGQTILGITDGALPLFCLLADFRGQHGFLMINEETVCSFCDGSFQSTTHEAKMVQLEELLLESDLDPETGGALFRTVAHLARHAQTQKHGCTLVIDLNPDPVTISGQTLEEPLDLLQPRLLDLAKALSKVDGALHITTGLHLHGFGCLLDGRTIPGEDLSRGARYNSALRFSAEHANIIVVVVSTDRPVAVIQEGVEISAQCLWQPLSGYAFVPEPLTAFIERNHD